MTNWFQTAMIGCAGGSGISRRSPDPLDEQRKKFSVQFDASATYNQSSMLSSGMPIPPPIGLSRTLLTWYSRHRRPLPWRENRDPYRVWVSEIMLQQTRVGAVIEHYEQFLKQFPSLEALASARRASVLAAWSGLGYYRRARNLHAAAKLLVCRGKGNFPQTSEQWEELPGIGRYTAAAIASIAFDEPRAAVDGNVQRVLVRLLGERRPPRALWQAAQQLVDPTRPGDFNQAMMELGATICTPSSPRCPKCPIESFCRSRGAAEPARQKLRPHRREIAYGLARTEHAVLLIRRDQGLSQMPGMWELPEVTPCHGAERPLFSLRHAITVTNFRVHVVEKQAPGPGIWVRISRLENLPLTGLTKKILRRAGIID